MRAAVSISMNGPYASDSQTTTAAAAFATAWRRPFEYAMRASGRMAVDRSRRTSVPPQRTRANRSSSAGMPW